MSSHESVEDTLVEISIFSTSIHQVRGTPLRQPAGESERFSTILYKQFLPHDNLWKSSSKKLKNIIDDMLTIPQTIIAHNIRFPVFHPPTHSLQTDNLDLHNLFLSQTSCTSPFFVIHTTPLFA